MSGPTQLHPDFGPAKTRLDASVDGGVLANFAQVMEIARTGDTPQSKAFYRVAIARWRALEGSPLSKGDRELQAMQAGLAGIEKKTP